MVAGKRNADDYIVFRQSVILLFSLCLIACRIMNFKLTLVAGSDKVILHGRIDLGAVLTRFVMLVGRTTLPTLYSIKFKVKVKKLITVGIFLKLLLLIGILKRNDERIQFG